MKYQINRIKNYMILFGTYFVYSLAGIFSKIASNQNTFLRTVVFVGMELVVLCIYAVIWQQVLKMFPLSVAMPAKGITIIYSLGFAAILFGETISMRNIIGAFVVLIGVAVSSDA